MLAYARSTSFLALAHAVLRVVHARPAAFLALALAGLVGDSGRWFGYDGDRQATEVYADSFALPVTLLTLPITMASA